MVNDAGVSLSGQGGDSGVAEGLAADLRAGGGTAVACADSVSDWNSAQRIVACALDTYGRIDAVIE